MRVPFSSSTRPGTGRVKRPGRKWSSSDSFSGTLSMKSRTFPFFQLFSNSNTWTFIFFNLSSSHYVRLFVLFKKIIPLPLPLFKLFREGFIYLSWTNEKKISLKKKNLTYFSNWVTQYLIICMVKCMFCSESDVLIAAVNCWYPTSDCAKEYST